MQRVINAFHNSVRTTDSGLSIRYVIRDHTDAEYSEGGNQPSRSLDDCAVCNDGHSYGSRDEAMDHLRQEHFPQAPADFELRALVHDEERLLIEERNSALIELLSSCVSIVQALHSTCLDILDHVSQTNITETARDGIPISVLNSFWFYVMFILAVQHTMKISEDSFKKWTFQLHSENTHPFAKLLKVIAQRGSTAVRLMKKALGDLLIMARYKEPANRVIYTGIGPQYIIAVLLASLSSQQIHH